jgi:glycosyltransferase involved in cell wall biosynthesis
MNLLVLDQFSDPGGAQQVLLELLPVVRNAGWHVLAGLPGDGELFHQIHRLGIETERIECGPYTSGRKSPADLARFLAGTPRLARQLRRLAKGMGAGLVYVNGPRLLPAAAMAGFGRPVLFHAHSYLGPGVVRRLAGESLRRMDAWVVGQCEFVAAPWRTFLPPERVSVIYNGVADPSGGRARSRAGPPRVGCIGRVAPEKGQREFVAVAARIHRAIPECQFAIYGSPLFGEAEAKRYAAQVRDDAEGLPIEFAGWVDDIGACLARLDLLLVPSTGYEATTRVILEAFAGRVPVIAFPSGGIPEVVKNGVGFLAKDSEEMADRAIELLLGDRGAAIVKAARESWERRFTLERYHREILQAMIRISRG